MSDGTVRGTFDLNTPAMGKLRDLRREGAATDRQMQQLGRTMDLVGGPTATRKLDDYSSRMRKLGSDADQMSARVSTAWDVQRRSVDDSATRIEGRIDVLDERMSRYGRQRVSATVELSGFDRVNAQLIELERRLDRLSRQRSSPSVGLTGGFGNMVGGGFPGGGAASSAGGGGGGGVGAAAKLAIGGAALLPGVQALGVSSVGLLGSAAGATLGAGVVGGGAVATLGTGALFSYAVAKPAVENLTKLDKAQVKYNETVRKYGDASKQAAVGRRELAAAESKMPGAGVALRQITSFRRDWERMTAPARNAVYGAVGNVAAAGRHALPTLSMAANTATSATAGQVSNFAGYLAGYQQQRTLVLLTQQFATELPIVERSLQNVTTTMGRLALSARPFFHEADVWVEHWTGGLAASTTNEARVVTTMRGLVQETKDWGRLGGAAFRTIRDIFNMGRPSGDSMVVSLTQTLDRWDAWIQRNPAKVERFFREAQTTTDKIAGALVSITKLLSQAATALQPIFNRGMGLISALSSLGPGATTGLSALLYGGYSGFRNARGGAGPSAGAVLATGVLGRPLRGGTAAVPMGVRMGGGVVAGAGGTSYLMPLPGGPTGVAATMGTQQLPLFIPRGAGVTTARPTPEAFNARYGGIEGARYGAPVSELGSAGGAGAARARGALGGAAKTVGATLAIMAGLEALGKGGSVGEVGQNFLSSGSFGLVHPVSNTGGAGAARAGAFLGALPGTLTPGQQQAAIAQKLASRLSESFTDKRTGFDPIGFLKPHGEFPIERSRYAGAHISPSDPFFMAQVGVQLRQLERTPGGRAKNDVQEITALRRAWQEAAAAKREYETVHNKELTYAAESHARSIGSQIGGAFGVERKAGRSPGTAFADVTGGALRQMKGLGREGARVLGQQMLQWAAQVKRSNPAISREVDALAKQIEGRFRSMGANVAIVNGRILVGTKEEWSSISLKMSEPIEQAHERMSKSFTAIQQEAIGSLRAMGFSPASAAQMVGNLERGGGAAEHAGAAVSAAQSGNVHAQHQQEMAANLAPNKKGHARGGMIGGKGLLDTVDVPGGKAAPGEAWIANRHTMGDLSRATIEKYGKTAQQMIAGETRLHSERRHATGGFVSTAYGPPWGGIEGGGQTATGIDLHGSPHEYIIAVDPSVIPLHSRAKVWPNPFGYRGDFAAEDTGGAIKGNRIDFYDWRGRADQNAWGRRNVTVTVDGMGGAIGAATGGAGTAQQIHLKARRSGLRGIPGALADRGSLLYAAALQKHINSRLPKSSMSVAGGVPSVGGVSGPKGLGTFDGIQVADWIIPELNWARAHGWTGHITSGYRPGRDPHTASGVSEHQGLQYPGGAVDFGGYNEGSNREAFERAAAGYRGRRLIPAQGFHDLGHMSGTGHQRGGRATWAGWHAKGGEYETRGPVIFGAGEGGRPERVSISPAGGKPSFGHGGHRIEVNIAHVAMASDADVEAVARQVAAKIVDELDALGEGPSDKELIGQ